MLVKKCVCVVLAGLSLAGLAASSGDGSSEEKAVYVKASKNDQAKAITLKQTDTNGNGVCWVRMPLSKKTAYTVWLEDAKSPSGAKPTIAITETYPESSFNMDFSKNPPSADFESVTIGTYKGWVMTGKNWEKENDKWDDPTGDDLKFKVPSTWNYFIVIRGAVGESANLHYRIGNWLPEGIPQNPHVIAPTTAVAGKTDSGLTFYSPSYFVETTFELGRRYYLATGGGTAGGALAFGDLPAGQVRADDAWLAGQYDQSIVLVPNATETKSFCLVTEKEDNFGKASLRYRVDPARTIAQHKFSTLSAGKPLAFKPGHLNAWDSGAYDAIVDESLFKFKAAKGRRYIVQATWTDPSRMTNMLMRLYDAKGKVLAENTGDGTGLNARCAIDAQSKATEFYIGVCQNLGTDDDFATPCYWPAEILVREVSSVTAATVTINPVPVQKGVRPLEGDSEGLAADALSAETWYQVFKINARAGATYDIYPERETGGGDYGLTATLYKMSGKKEVVLDTFDFTPGSGDITFTASATQAHYLRVSVKEGRGLDYAPYHIYAIGYSDDGKAAFGSLKVSPKGAASATWSITSEKLTYAAGESVLLPQGTYTVKYGSVKGYSAPLSRKVTVSPNAVTLVDDDFYGDTYDPKDDATSGKVGSVKYAATKWTIKDKETVQRRTLWDSDPADNFSFTSKEGYFYDFYFTDHGCSNAVFTIKNSKGEVARTAEGTEVRGVTEIRQLALPAGTWVIAVEHGAGTTGEGSYALAGFYANVGAIKFAKKAVTVKDTDTSVKLSVQRTAKKGSVKVRYEIVDGTAKAGEDFYAATGVLSWADKDNKAKTVPVRLIPKLGAWYDGGNRQFTVRLVDAHEEGDYTARISSDTCTVTVKETSKPSVTQATVYAKKAAKRATVKSSENVDLQVGTFVGVLRAEEATVPDAGFAEFASVTITSAAATSKKAAALTAKVVLAGKTYTFKSTDGWDAEGETFVKTLRLVQKVSKVNYTNELTVTLTGAMKTAQDWQRAGGSVTLAMNVPAVNAKGLPSGVRYGGSVWRKNEKIQGYLDGVLKFAGYYTSSLVATDTLGTDFGTADRGTPEGHGCLTMTVSNKGAVKLAGTLADGTKISYSSTAGLVADASSPVGCKLVVPVYQAKSPFILAGQLVLKAVASEGRLDGIAYDIVLDAAASGLVWNNDSTKLTYDAKQGWRKALQPVGGWYDTVFNLQSYYRESSYVVETATEFPKELLSSGYQYVSLGNAQPNGCGALLAGNAFSLDKRVMVKDGKSYDFANCVNPCNVQVKVARATGLVSGSFSLWSESVDGSKAKEIKAFKHSGVLLMQRDGADMTLSPDVFTAGYCLGSVKVTTTDAKNKKTTRTWKCSLPFNLKDVDE